MENQILLSRRNKDNHDHDSETPPLAKPLICPGLHRFQIDNVSCGPITLGDILDLERTATSKKKGQEAIALRLEAIATRLEAIALRLQAIATGCKAACLDQHDFRLRSLFTSAPLHFDRIDFAVAACLMLISTLLRRISETSTDNMLVKPRQVRIHQMMHSKLPLKYGAEFLAHKRQGQDWF